MKTFSKKVKFVIPKENLNNAGHETRDQEPLVGDVKLEIMFEQAMFAGLDKSPRKAQREWLRAGMEKLLDNQRLR